MGWTSYHIDCSAKEELDRLFTGNLVDGNNEKTGEHKVLRSCMKGFTYYAAMECTYLNGRPREVVGIITLVKLAPKSYYNFSYKDMTENFGPYRCECPESILKLLTPTQNEYALRWRKDCWDNIEKRKKLNKVPMGGMITFKDDGKDIVLTKYRMSRHKAGWCDGRYRWRVSLIPCEFEIVKTKQLIIGGLYNYEKEN